MDVFNARDRVRLDARKANVNALLNASEHSQEIEYRSDIVPAVNGAEVEVQHSTGNFVFHKQFYFF
jgi:hypothetical protein